MSTQTIQFVETKRDILETFLPDSFQLRRDRGWLWIQYAAIWILRKLGCYAISKSIVLKRHVIDAPRFIEALWQQQQSIFQCYHYKGERLLIGPEEFQQLCGSVEEIGYPVSMKLAYSWNDTRQGATICGLKITVVPWMKGMLVVPREFPEDMAKDGQ